MGDEKREDAMASEPLTDDEMRTWLSFLQAATWALRGLDRDLAGWGLSLEDYETLAFLSMADSGKLSMKELVRDTLQEPSRLTYRVTKLEEQGYVTRCDGSQDKRFKEVTLTNKGRDILEKAWPDHLKSVRERVIEPLKGDAHAAESLQAVAEKNAPKGRGGLSYKYSEQCAQEEDADSI